MSLSSMLFQFLLRSVRTVPILLLLNSFLYHALHHALPFLLPPRRSSSSCGHQRLTRRFTGSRRPPWRVTQQAHLTSRRDRYCIPPHNIRAVGRPPSFPCARPLR